MRLSKYCCGLVAMLPFLWASSAMALGDSDKEAIRNLSNQGAADYEHNQFELARDKFQRAYAIAKVPRLAVWQARANEKLGHLVAAYELYRQALNLEPNELWKGDLQQKAQQEAQTELDQLQPRIPRLTVSVEGASSNEITLTIDGAVVPSGLLGVERLVDPNQRQIVGKRGSEVVTETVQLAEGDHKTIILKFAPGAAMAATTARTTDDITTGNPNGTSNMAGPATGEHAASKGNTQRTIGWIGVGLGAAGLALGATTGILVAVKHGNLDDQCPNGICHSDSASELRSYRTLRTLSTVSFIVGGVAMAAGVTLLLTKPKQENQPAVGLFLSPGAVEMRGAF